MKRFSPSAGVWDTWLKPGVNERFSVRATVTGLGGFSLTPRFSGVVAAPERSPNRFNGFLPTSRHSSARSQWGGPRTDKPLKRFSPSAGTLNTWLKPGVNDRHSVRATVSGLGAFSLTPRFSGVVATPERSANRFNGFPPASRHSSASSQWGGPRTDKPLKRFSPSAGVWDTWLKPGVNQSSGGGCLAGWDTWLKPGVNERYSVRATVSGLGAFSLTPRFSGVVAAPARSTNRFNGFPPASRHSSARSQWGGPQIDKPLKRFSPSAGTLNTWLKPGVNESLAGLCLDGWHTWLKPGVNEWYSVRATVSGLGAFSLTPRFSGVVATPERSPNRFNGFPPASRHSSTRSRRGEPRINKPLKRFSPSAGVWDTWLKPGVNQSSGGGCLAGWDTWLKPGVNEWYSARATVSGLGAFSLTPRFSGVVATSERSLNRFNGFPPASRHSSASSRRGEPRINKPLKRFSPSAGVWDTWLKPGVNESLFAHMDSRGGLMEDS